MNFKPTKQKFLNSLLVSAGLAVLTIIVMAIAVPDPNANYSLISLLLLLLVVIILAEIIFIPIYVIWSLFDKKENQTKMWKSFFIFCGILMISIIVLFFIIANAEYVPRQDMDNNENIKFYMFDALKDSPDKIIIKGDDVNFKAGDRRDFYFAVKNEKSEQTLFKINVSCKESLISLKTISSANINSNEVVVGKIAVTIGSTIKPDTYFCLLNVIDSTTSTTYAEKQFNVTIE